MIDERGLTIDFKWTSQQQLQSPHHLSPSSHPVSSQDQAQLEKLLSSPMCLPPQGTQHPAEVVGHPVLKGDGHDNCEKILTHIHNLTDKRMIHMNVLEN